MKVNVFKCPNCGANLKPDLLIKYNFTSCPYCNLQLNISNIDEHIVVDKNININKRIIDDAEIVRAQIENKKHKRETILPLIYTLLPVLIGLLIWGIISINGNIAEAKGKVKAGYYKDYIGLKYTAVVPQFEALGFTNITTVDLNDAGWFSSKTDTVETISVNGNSGFESLSYFNLTDPVIITYH